LLPQLLSLLAKLTPGQVIAQCGRARSSRLTLPHYTALTPMFMPVGTQGTVKGLTTQQLEDIGCQARRQSRLSSRAVSLKAAR
jgi:hypothetical protein